ncbi:MAG TPA: MFS transporter [Gaiellaceae bacterium]|jgi:MFS family permease|nr:MFS transporter [Gaiellaceae bacterium]
MAGGVRALVPLYAASAVLTLGEGSFALLVPPYMHSRGISTVVIGAAISAYGLVSLAARIPSGAVYRSHRAWSLIAGGCILSSLAFALITRTANPVLLTAFVALDGAGFAIATTANMAALIERRPEGSNAGSIMGWYTGSLGAGYAVAGFVGGSLGDAVGAGDAILILALVPLVAGTLLALVVGRTAPARRDGGEAIARTAWWRDLRHVAPLVWLAFFVTLYINLVSGVLLTFFPIYGLAIGLTLTQIGVLQGIHGAAAAAVRFLSGLVFRWVSYERTLPVMVLVSGLSVAAIGGIKALVVLGAAWATLGLTRGLLRVSSAALVMDEAGETDARRGAASGIYLAGLDLGKVLGPLAGGIGADVIGIRATFLVASVSFPVVYFVLAALLGRRRARDTAPAYAASTLQGDGS